MVWWSNSLPRLELAVATCKMGVYNQEVTDGSGSSCKLTSDGHTDRGAVWSRNCDIDIRGEIPAGKFWGEVPVHVERIRVDVQFVAKSVTT
jgi:hypothetical protein